MKKKAAALAVGALFAAPAVQAQITMGNETIGTVQIYGKLYPQFIVAKGQGSSQPGTEVSTLTAAGGVLGGSAVSDHGQRNAVDSQNTYVGFRGERSLGGAQQSGDQDETDDGQQHARTVGPHLWAPASVGGAGSPCHSASRRACRPNISACSSGSAWS